MSFCFSVCKTLFPMRVDSAIQQGVFKCQQSSRLLGNAYKDQKNLTYGCHSGAAQLRAAQNRASNEGQKM